MFLSLLAVPDVISDEESNDSELDSATVGCLGFLPMSGLESPAKTLPTDSERTPSKTDIAAASPGAVGTDPESQSAFRKERAEAEKLREKEKLDVNYMQRQYMRMRKLQKKNMLVFTSFSNQTTRPKNEMRSKAINHLFIDLPSFDKEKRTQRQTGYPFVTSTTNAKGKTQNARRANESVGEVSETVQNNNEFDTKESSKTAIKNVVEIDCSQTEPLQDNARNLINKQKNTQKNTQRNTQHDTQHDKIITNVGGSLISTSFKVDKNAMYPANFKPFPQRAQMPRSKLFISNAIGNSLQKGKQKNLTNISNTPVR